MKNSLLGFGILILGFMISGCSAPTATTTKIDNLTLSVSMRPDPPQPGNNNLIVKLIDSQKKIIDNASIGVAYIMPAMPQMGMPEMRGKAQANFKNGQYEAPVDLSMNGNWLIRIDISGGGEKTGYVEYSLITGTKGLSLKESSFGKAGEVVESAAAESGIRISSEKQQLIGVKTEIARFAPLNKIIRTVGTVAHDIELFNAQNEYQQAVIGLKKAKEEGDPEVIKNAEELEGAAYLKLGHMGLSDKLISEIQNGDQSLIVGGQGGLVWIYGKIYESDIPVVKSGMKVRVTSQNIPGKVFTGKIASLDPYLDEATRSLKIRALVSNKEGFLKPNMYVEVIIEAPQGTKLLIPEDSIIDTGERQLVYVEKKRGIFEQREVTVGQRSAGQVEILSGIKAGEKVVAAGTFLIDSETRLKSTSGNQHKH